MSKSPKALKFASVILCLAMLLASCASVSDGGDATADASDIPATEATTAATTVAETEDEEEMKTYTVKTFESKDAIDWDAVPGAKVNNYRWVECREFDTTAKLVYVKGFGFVCKMTCLESNPVATYTVNDDPVCLDSCMEFFACYAGDGYLNIEANSIGTTCIQFGESRANRVSLRRRFKEPFVVTPEVKADEWSLTMEIPLDKLRSLYGEHVTDELFVSGYSFTGNFYKTGGAVETGNEHYGMWNVVGTENPDFHQPPYFGTFVIE